LNTPEVFAPSTANSVCPGPFMERSLATTSSVPPRVIVPVTDESNKMVSALLPAVQPLPPPSLSLLALAIASRRVQLPLSPLSKRVDGDVGGPDAAGGGQ